MNNLITIGNVLNETIYVLAGAGENNWRQALIHHRDRLNGIDSPAEFEAARDDLMRMYGGMGSYSDLVLYRDKKLLKDENRNFNTLRKELFRLLSDRKLKEVFGKFFTVHAYATLS